MSDTPLLTGAAIHSRDCGALCKQRDAAGWQRTAGAACLPDNGHCLQGHVPQRVEPEPCHHWREWLRQNRDHQDCHAGLCWETLLAPALLSHNLQTPHACRGLLILDSTVGDKIHVCA